MCPLTISLLVVHWYHPLGSVVYTFQRTQASRVSTGTASHVEVRVCPLCQGQGRIKEYYGYREMTVRALHLDATALSAPRSDRKSVV